MTGCKGAAFFSPNKFDLCIAMDVPALSFMTDILYNYT